MKLDFSRQILEKCSNIKFYKNPSNGDEFFYVDRHKYRKTDKQRDMTKLMVAFRNFASAPKMYTQTKQKKAKTRVTDALIQGGA
jgi:hypothetical protein